MTEFGRWEHEGKLYRLVYDEHHQTRGSYAYETEAETRAAEDEEIAKLQSGEWVCLGVLESYPCPGAHHEGHPDDVDSEAHCGGCSGRVDGDSCWGFVVDSSYSPERIVRECWGI